MTTQIEPSLKNQAELFEVAAVLVCKGYAQGTRKALFAACREVYECQDIGPSATYTLFIEANKTMARYNLVSDAHLDFRGGWVGGGTWWLSPESKELLMMCFIWAHTLIQDEIVGDKGQVPGIVTPFTKVE